MSVQKRVNRSITIDIKTGCVLARDAYQWDGKWALCEGEDGGGDDGGGDDGGKGDDKVGSDNAALTARLDAIEKENRELKAAQDADKRKRNAKKAEADGKLKEELEKSNEELAKLRERNERIEKATRERIERNIAKLPEDARADIELVRDDLSIEKLEALVDKRMGSTKSVDEDKDKDKDQDDKDKKVAPPAPGVRTTNSEPNVGHEIHAETKNIMRAVYAKPEAYEISKHIGVDSVGKFGWGRTDDENENKANFINLLDTISAQPVGGVPSSAKYNRILGDKK